MLWAAVYVQWPMYGHAFHFITEFLSLRTLSYQVVPC